MVERSELSQWRPAGHARRSLRSADNGRRPTVRTIAGEFDAGAQDALHQPPNAIHPFALMHELVTVTAGEYFFAPSLKALKRLAAGATTS